MAVLLALVASMLALLVVGLLTGAGSTTAVPHPDFAPMLHGVDDGRLGAPPWAGYAIGLLIIGSMWVVMYIGFRPGHWVRRAVTVCNIGYALGFVALMRAHADFECGETTIVAGFTEPTAWLVYGMMLSPWILLLITAFTFPEAYFGDEEQARFEALLAQTARGEDE